VARLERPPPGVQHEVPHGSELDRLARVHQALTAEAAAPLLRRQRREGHRAQALSQGDHELQLGVQGESIPYHRRPAGEADQQGWRKAKEGTRNAVLEPLPKCKCTISHGPAPGAACIAQDDASGFSVQFHYASLRQPSGTGQPSSLSETKEIRESRG